jgi:hypothetical protein
MRLVIGDHATAGFGSRSIDVAGIVASTVNQD